MDVAFEFDLPENTFIEIVKFQSLFLWMLLLNHLTLQVYGYLFAVSILVLMDVAFEYVPANSNLAPIILFQSLFLWMLLLNTLRC